MIVVDLGCYDPPGGFDSLASLRERFNPDKIYGFDPQAQDMCSPGLEIRGAAAWTHDGSVRFTRNGTESRLNDGGEEVPCFDFSAWLATVGRCVVKMDIEGAEYSVLEKMRADGTVELVDLLVVEWHGEPLDVACPVETWWN